VGIRNFFWADRWKRDFPKRQGWGPGRGAWQGCSGRSFPGGRMRKKFLSQPEEGGGVFFFFYDGVGGPISTGTCRIIERRENWRVVRSIFRCFPGPGRGTCWGRRDFFLSRFLLGGGKRHKIQKGRSSPRIPQVRLQNFLPVLIFTIEKKYTVVSGGLGGPLTILAGGGGGQGGGGARQRDLRYKKKKNYLFVSGRDEKCFPGGEKGLLEGWPSGKPGFRFSGGQPICHLCWEQV